MEIIATTCASFITFNVTSGKRSCDGCKWAIYNAAVLERLECEETLNLLGIACG